MSISKRLYLSFTVIILFTLFAGGVALYSLYLVNDDAVSIYDDGLLPITKISSVIVLAENTRVQMLEGVLLDEADAFDIVNENLEQINRAVEELRGQVAGQSEREALDEFSQEWAEFTSSIENNQNLHSTGNVNSAISALEEGGVHYDAAVVHLRNLMDQLVEDAGGLMGEVEDVYGTANIFVSIMFGGTILIGLACAVYLVRRIVIPVVNVRRRVQEIAEGDGDLTQRIDMKGIAEIGDLIRYVNQFIDHVHQVVNRTKETSLQVSASAQQLLANTEEMNIASNQTAEAMQQIATEAETQVHSAQESAASITETANGVQHIADRANEMSESSEMMSVEAQQGNESMQKTVQQIKEIQGAVSETAASIKKLGERSDEIGQIINVITDISAQTNLLALNAAIEAARAGEHGHGFAVVADEVRKLAEQSEASANKIAELIENIQEDTHTSVAAMDGVTSEVQTGATNIEQAGAIFASIVQKVQDMSAGIQEISATTQQLSASSEQVMSSVDEMKNISEGTASQTQYVAAGTEEQLASMQEITASAESLNKIAQELEELVGRFKV